MIYLGVSEAGAYAVIDGDKVEVRSCSGNSLFPRMHNLKASNTRCVIEMTNPGVETAALPQSASEVAYKICRMRNLPFMVVKRGTWEREFKMDGSTVALCKSIFPGVEIETRADGVSPEANALLLAEYARRSL